MANQTLCFTPLLGKMLRLIALDSCGNVPATGTANAVVQTEGFITVKLSAQVEAGADIVTKKADGSLCVNTKVADSFKRFDVEMEFCGVDPGALSLVTNAQIYQDASSNNAGIVVPEGQITKAFSLELWTGVQGQCAAGAAVASGYLLLPYVNGGVIGDMEVNGEKAISFSMKGGYTRGGNNWGVGPYSVLNGAGGAGTKAKLPSPLDPSDHLLLVQTNVAPPPSLCGLQMFSPS